MEVVQRFSVSFCGIIGRDRKVKSHSIDLGELVCDETGELIEPIKIEEIKEKAKTVLDSAKSIHPASIPTLRSYFTEYERDGQWVITKVSPFSDKNKKYLLN
jgi:hypothetical protein